MEKINKKKNEKDKINKRRKSRVKRKISIFTIMLWIFLISTMTTITVNSTKKTNALEVEDKNWNIGLVMYDRSSTTPNEAITEFTWNVVNENETKQLCMQINYACTTGKEYRPGEVVIEIPGIAKDSFSEFNRSSNRNNNWLKNNVTIAADNEQEENKEYDFSYRYDEKNNIYTFTNNHFLELNEHFEGSIQIVYNLEPIFRIKTDLEFKTRLKENIVNAEEIIAVESNICNFHYTSEKGNYTLTKKALAAPKMPIKYILDDYYWVSYSFKYKKTDKVISILDRKVKDIFPEECIIYDATFNELEKTVNNEYYLSCTSNLESKSIQYYVGYPKSIYNLGDKITNTAELWGRYEDEVEVQKFADARSEVVLEDFDFEYKGQLYNISKRWGYIGSVNKKELQTGTFWNSWRIYPDAFYSGSLMDVEIIDDLLYTSRENGEYTKLEDNEYNFTEIEIPIFYTYNKYTESMSDALIGYKYEVQVRYKDIKEYVVYNEGITQNESKIVKFDRNDIVGVKLIIRDLDKTLYSKSKLDNYTGIEVRTNIYPSNCAEGNLYNFCSLQVFIKDNDGNRILHNEVDLDNYTTDMTKLKIAEYDMKTYGRYVQRGCVKISIYNSYVTLNGSKSRYSFKNNVKEEKYEVKYKLSSLLTLNCYEMDKDLVIKQYDILPEGMKLSSSKEEMINSISLIKNFNLDNLKLKDGTIINSIYKFEDYIRKNVKIEIDYNYKDSGRTKVSIIYDFNDIDFSYYNLYQLHIHPILYLNVDIPYDSIEEYGTKYVNHSYLMWNTQEYEYYRDFELDDGRHDSLASDIDNDGDTEEKLLCGSNTLNITHAVSSKQAVIKQLKTDMTNGKFVSDMAFATAGSEYTYKLRVKTGANSLKDLIIYDSLETILDSEENEISNGWKGEFLGVDTEYAMSKGYAPVIYYSEEKNPGKLTEVPEKWMELTSEVDKTTVKSICVDLRYKVDGSEMELTSNNLVYVLVNMKAPNDSLLTTSASNMFSTNWRAKDPMGTVIDNIDGIYSNEVSVKIFKEEDRKKDIVGSKVWEDYSKIPSSIKVKLFQDEIEYMSCEVTTEDDWKYVFKNVPVYKNSELEKYEYRIEEEKVPYYEAKYNGYDIINTLSGKDIKGRKTWEYNWLDKNKPKSIIVKLMQDGIEYMRQEVTGGNNWEYKFEDVPMYKNDSHEEYAYTIEEVENPRYEAIYDGYNITNNLKKKDIEVTKIWDDNNNEHGLRPKFILIKVYDGENLVMSHYLSGEDGWKYEVTGLPEFREDGSKIEYTIDEEVEEYREEYWGAGYWEHIDNFEHSGDFELYNKYYVKEIVGNTITNKYVDPDERIKITGKKIWEDEDNKANKRPKSVILQLKVGDEVVNEALVTEATNWNYEFEVAKYDEEGNEIEYHIDEKDTPKFYEKELTDATTVTNRFKIPNEMTKIEVIKLWEDLEDKYEKRPNKVTLQVLSKDKVVAEQIVNEKSNWRHEFELPKYDEYGNEIEYTVDEKEEVENYEKRISGYTVINKCTYEPIEDVTDTSDINIFMYISIFFVAVIGIIAGILFVKNSKK